MCNLISGQSGGLEDVEQMWNYKGVLTSVEKSKDRNNK